MAVSTFQRDPTYGGKISDHYTSGEADGLNIYYRRYGNVVCVWCSDGEVVNAIAAKGVLATLPEGFRPPAFINATDFGSNGTRIRIRSSGNIETMAAKSSGNTVIFSITFMVDS